ncbi:MAG: hypothetical protein WCO35_02785 [Candidatus Nomurabacteria bacterium]
MPQKKIDEITLTFGTYMNPGIFNKDFVKGLKYLKNFDQKRFNKYNKILLAISWFSKKLLRYELYFSKFYNENISDTEALEHHVNSYLQDTEALKNKLLNYLGSLKNDLKKIYVNKEDIEKVYKHLSSQIEKSFKKVTLLSTEHRHGNFRFLDSDLIEAQTMSMLLEQKNILPLSAQGINLVNARLEESLKKSKDRWIKNANNNESQIIGVVEETLERTEDMLYKAVGIEKVIFNNISQNEIN